MIPLAQKTLLILASLMGFFSVAAGAFGAHALKQKITEDLMNIFEIGARYQMYHSLAIFAAIYISRSTPSLFPVAAGWAFFIGSFIFSGSLYILALTGIRSWGAITPIGGVILLIGWACLVAACYLLDSVHV